MPIAFAGTPPFAAAALEALVAAGHDVALVLTQPDRPSGRGMKLKPSAVKEAALRHGLAVMTPRTLSVRRDAAEAEPALAAIEGCGAEVLVVAAYGLILPALALEAASVIGAGRAIKSMNIHGSLLPRWRGAAPVQRAIEAGDAETGVTLMGMEAGLDTGPMIRKCPTPILPGDTAGTLMARMGEIVTYAEKILKSEATVDWRDPAAAIERRLRAFTPFPGMAFARGGETIKLKACRLAEGAGAPGTVLAAGGRRVVACG